MNAQLVREIKNMEITPDDDRSGVIDGDEEG